MGQTLSEPVVEKLSESGEDDRLAYGLSSMQGWRITMEDAHAAVLDLQKEESSQNTNTDERLSFFGVYDGHGGDRVATFSGANVHKILSKQAAFENGDFEQALKDGFLATDRAILQDSRYSDEVSGCTASAALITNNKIYVANAGDSRTVLGIKGKAKPLSFDHKPQNKAEKDRIVAAGGFVDFGRVNGNLALSRAIGDFEFKKSASLPPEQQIVTAYPDVVVHELSDDDEFLVVACDGIWDCLSSQAVVEYVRRGIVAKQELHEICENLMDGCLSRNSETGGVGCDNMTMVIVALLRGKSKDQWYEMVAKRVADGDGPCAPFNQASHKPIFGEYSPDEFDDDDESLNNIPKNRAIYLPDVSDYTDTDDSDMFSEDYDKDGNDHEKHEKMETKVKADDKKEVKKMDDDVVLNASESSNSKETEESNPVV